MIASPKSGSGKTALTLSLLYSFSRKGIRVRPYKVGPDYLDGTYHKLACGEDSYNLDTWMLEHDYLKEIFFRTSEGYDLAIIEGVMGLFDGYGGTRNGSSAEVAALLGLPVVLVVDCSGFSGSIAPLVHGFHTYDSDVKIEGVILNNVASENHLRYLETALQTVGVPVFGHIYRNEDLTLDHRHLGLVTAFSSGIDTERLKTISELVTEHIDLDRILEISIRSCKQDGYDERKVTFLKKTSPVCTIGVAYDEGFHFYYRTNLDLLAWYGADIVHFSPLHDREIPENVVGLYIGGGYPEIYAGALSANREMLESIRRFAERDGVIYAECGGLIYLGRSIEAESSTHRLCGIFALDFRMLEKRTRLGYQKVQFMDDTVIGTKNAVARGHEFHYSEMLSTSNVASLKRSYRIEGRNGEQPRLEGFSSKNVLGSYVHIHFGSNVHCAEQFVKNCSK
jgi:cobyrinic acid a,c-diamide synthase